MIATLEKPKQGETFKQQVTTTVSLSAGENAAKVYVSTGLLVDTSTVGY